MSNDKSPRRAAQEKMLAFVAAQSGAVLDEVQAASIIGDDLVVCGAPAELAKVLAWAERLAGEGVCTIDPCDADDPDFADWTVARISMPRMERAALDLYAVVGR